MLGMQSMLDTISSIEENSQKMAYKPFKSRNVNQLAKEEPILTSFLSDLA
jgi:hypothetical protein